MDCPFLRNPLDIEAVIIRNALRRERIFRPRLDVLSFPESFLFERYRFSSATIIYLNHILRPYITNLTHRGRALTSEQTLCIALRFFEKPGKDQSLNGISYLRIFSDKFNTHLTTTFQENTLLYTHWKLMIKKFPTFLTISWSKIWHWCAVKWLAYKHILPLLEGLCTSLSPQCHHRPLLATPNHLTSLAVLNKWESKSDC